MASLPYFDESRGGYKVYYAVRKGRKAGVYESWEEARKQVDGFPGAVFKKFECYVDAEDYAFPNIVTTACDEEQKETAICIEAYTDGSFLNNKAGWGYVLLKNGQPFFEGYGRTINHLGMRNIASEIEAAENAIKKAFELGATRVDVYHDYEGIGRWPDKDWRTTKERTAAYSAFVTAMRAKMAIHFHKVKGHSSTKMNDRADTLAALGTKATAPVEQYMLSAKEVPSAKTPDKPDSFSAVLKHWRENKGLSVAAAARETQVASYAKLEAGDDTKVSTQTMQQLYSVCCSDLSISDFLMLWFESGNKCNG